MLHRYNTLAYLYCTHILCKPAATDDDDELDYETPPESSVDDVEDDIFDHITSLPSLNAGSLVDDDSLLASATDKLRLEFASLFTKVRLSLKKLGVSPESFLSHLKSVEAFGHSFETVFISQSETFASTISRPLKSFEDIFPAIAPYCSWFNHLLIENILDTFCDDDEKIMQKWQRFKGKFTKYCEARLCKCPLDRFGEDSTSVVANTTSVVMKIDTHWRTVKVKQICVIRDTISELLQIKPYNLYLRAVQNGCVELLFYVPMFVAERFIPPSAEQVVALKKACVVQLRCDPDFAARRYDTADISGSIPQPLTMKDFSNLEDVAQYLSTNALKAYREFVRAPALETYNHLRSISFGHRLRVMGDSLAAKLQNYGPLMIESADMFGYAYMIYDYISRPANMDLPAIYLGGLASVFLPSMNISNKNIISVPCPDYPNINHDYSYENV